jgi:NAD(P)-dependent dehydrogenase (short-subunit alcohol dehydrogenase family)
MDLAGKVALVTGSKRIGADVALAIAQHGADVAIVYRSSRAEADATRAAVEAIGRRAVLVCADLRHPDDCMRVVRETVESTGRCDVLVNMASVYTRRVFDDLTLEDWNAAMEVDLRASYLCARAVVPFMRRAGGGCIVNFADWVAASRRPRYSGFLPYYVAKGAIVSLTEALALELAADNIRVNAIAPGPIVPPEGTSPATYAAVERATPLGRWGGGQEIAKAVLALIDSEFITGEVVRVDGGRHLL